MERRDLLKMIAAATSTGFVCRFASAYDIRPPVELKDTGFSNADVALLNEVGETIIPRTNTPGAKDANVGAAIAVIVADCYTDTQKSIFKAGMKALNGRSQTEYKTEFTAMSSENKLALLTELDAEAKQHINEQKGKGEDKQPHYFTLFKQLVLFTFFTSEKGANEVLRHVSIPGKYDGEYPYKKGDRAWYR